MGEHQSRRGRGVPAGTGGVTANPRLEVVSCLFEEWDAIEKLLDELADEDWSTPALPGWTVQDAVAHLVGTESMLSGETPPSPDFDVAELDHVRNQIAVANELWVESYRAKEAQKVRDDFRSVTTRRRQALAEMTDEEFEQPSWTPVGPGTLGRFLEIRVFDCWVHEQDIRSAVGRPGHESGRCAEMSLNEIERALGFVVGKKAGLPDGSSVTFELTSPVERTTHVLVNGRAAVVPELRHEATVTLAMSSSLFMRLACGRTEPSGQGIEITGDQELGRKVLENLAFTI